MGEAHAAPAGGSGLGVRTRVRHRNREGQEEETRRHDPDQRSRWLRAMLLGRLRHPPASARPETTGLRPWRTVRAVLPIASEARLFEALRAGKLGVTFRRQAPVIRRFIADLPAPEVRLVVEIDGLCHDAGRRPMHVVVGAPAWEIHPTAQETQ